MTVTPVRRQGLCWLTAFICLPNSCLATHEIAAVRKRVGHPAWSAQRCFLQDPFPVGLCDLARRNFDDLRRVVRMMRTNVLLQCGIPRVASFDHHQDFFGALELSLPG